MRYIFLLFFVLVSCESQNNIHEQNVNLLNEVIDEVLRAVKNCKIKKIIIDPVMIAKGGHPLINNNAIMKLKKIINLINIYYYSHFALNI